MLKNIPPTTFIIFGVTSDLSQRKLLPALLDLYINDALPKNFRVLGFSRRPEWNDNDFREFVKKAINKKKHHHPKTKIKKFLDNLIFQHGYFDDLNAYKQLRQKLLDMDTKHNMCAYKLFYLSVSPEHYDTIFNNLKKSNLTGKYEAEECTRILVEKPFGHDLKTAQKLDKKLGRLFKESQIFRIDHYLAKESLQNILMFRFSNALFEPLWNNKYISKVEIIFNEKLGLEERGDYYDKIGSLRDVGQNHLMQMLALVAMDDPKKLNIDAIRQKRAEVLKSVEPIKKENMEKQVLRAQWQGYKKEKGISKNSKTETFFRIKAFVNSKRWKGVPFYLQSGKNLNASHKKIKVYFKERPTCICDLHDQYHLNNILTFQLEPKEGISTLFWAKKPGFTMEPEPRELHFYYNENKDIKRLPDAYERILFDCVRGDQTLFASTEEVMAAWRFVTPILKNINKTKLHTYKPGSVGPKAKLP